MQPSNLKPKPKPALKKAGQKFGAYNVPVRAAVPHSAPQPAADSPASAAAKPRLPTQITEHDKPPGQGNRRALRSASSKGSRSRRGSQQSSRQSSQPGSQADSDANSDSDASDKSRARRLSGVSAASNPEQPAVHPDVREATAESILGLWDVNRAQEKIAEKEVVRERKHRASQEGFQIAPQVIDDNVILRQRLSLSKWKGAVKAVGAVNKMGMLVKSRPPSAPAASALVNQSRQGTTGEQRRSCIFSVAACANMHPPLPQPWVPRLMWYLVTL